MPSFCSKLLELSVTPCIQIVTLKTLQLTLITQDLPRIPLCPSSHWISLSKSCHYFHYFDALPNLYCPSQTHGLLLQLRYSHCTKLKLPFSPFGSINASFPQTVIHSCASVIPGLIIHLFTAATPSCCYLKNGTPFCGDAVILHISTQRCLHDTHRVEG